MQRKDKAMVETRKRTMLFCALMTVMICMGFMLCMLFTEEASAEEGEYSLKVEGTEGVTEVYSNDAAYYPDDLLQKRTITVVDDKGVSRDFKFKLLDYYDSDWKRMEDYGFTLYKKAIWEEGIDLVNMENYIGQTISFQFLIYRCSEDGTPVDEGGNPVELKDAEVLAVSDPISIKIMKYNPTVTINGINYTVFLQEKEDGAIVYVNDEITDPKSLKGKVTVLKNVTIEGTKYPVTAISPPGFAGCSNMTQIVLPDTITDIRNGSFCDTGLKSITLPDSVKSIAGGSIGFNEDKPVPGFVIYAKNNPVAEDYAYDNGFKYIDGNVAKATKVKMSAKSLKSHKAKLTWNKNTYVTGYQIYRASKKKGKYKKAAVIKKPSAVKWTSKKQKKGKTVYYKMRAYTKISDKTYYGKWSAIKRVKIK